MQITRRDGALAAGAVLLLAVAVVRLAVPDRSRMRSLSIEGFDIKSEPIASGQEIQRTASWNPPEDLYVVGWSYEIGSSAGWLALMQGQTRLFSTTDLRRSANPAFFAGGTGFRVRKGEPLTLHYRVLNTGGDGQTMGASAVVYFVPVEGN
jgi:hypothetical protein